MSAAPSTEPKARNRLARLSHDRRSATDTSSEQHGGRGMSLPEVEAVEVFEFAAHEIRRDRDQFTRELLRELAGVLEESVGVEDAQGFIALVGNRIGLQLDEEYRSAAGVGRLSVGQIAGAFVDLKRRIDGGFVVESIEADAIVLVNDACPFGRYVEGRTSLCMMTSNVFGRIAADNLGYARVELQSTIAAGDSGCRVVVRFSDAGPGREYFGD